MLASNNIALLLNMRWFRLQYDQITASSQMKYLSSVYVMEKMRNSSVLLLLNEKEEQRDLSGMFYISIV